MKLKQNSQHQDSLTDISRRQYTNRGLTSVSDSCFELFCSLTERILNEFSGEIFSKHGSAIHTHCLNKLLDSSGLFQQFAKCMGTNTNINMTSTECTTSELLCEICELSSGVIEVFNDLLKKYLMVMFGQFRKDIKCHMHIEKTMAHRKQIKVKSLKREKKTNEKNNNPKTNTVEATCSTSSTSDNERTLVTEHSKKTKTK